MQPSNNNREMQSINSLLSQQQFQLPFDPTSSHDDFLEQMLSSINNPSSPWADLSDPVGGAAGDDHHYTFDDQSLLTNKFRHHQINGGGGACSPSSAVSAAKALMLQQQIMLTRSNGFRPPSVDGNNGLLPSPLSPGSGEHNDGIDGSATFKSTNPANDSSVQPIFNGFAGSLSQSANQSQHFNNNNIIQAQNLGGTAAAALTQAAPLSGFTAGGGGSGAPAQPRQQRVRARRGQATDPHSIAERLRRERIAERMKALQELVPNANKTDKASMLDEIIDYVKFLQLQVKVLSMSRLGGAGAVAPFAADRASEAGGDRGRVANKTQTPSSSNNENGMTVTEHQVAKLMEEDMGSAMQYLQGKGLCLMPISLATAISTATCHSRNNPMNNIIPTNFSTHKSNGGAEPSGPSSPNMSVLSVQSATLVNGTAEPPVKEGVSISKS